MIKKKICVIAQFPPPIHGLSKAVDTLFKSELLNEKYDLIKIDITNNKLFVQNYRRIIKTKADLFYFTISQSIGGNLRDLLIMEALIRNDKKCIIHLHGGYFRKLYDEKMLFFQKIWNRKLLNSLSGAIVLGNSLRYIFKDLVTDENIYVIPNCVDDEFLMQENDVKKKIPNNGVYHVLFLSNMIRSKGYDIVLDMAKQYKENPGYRKLHFDFAGKFYEKEDEKLFYEYVSGNGLENVVTYHGVVLGEAKKDLLRKSSFFILPTHYSREGQPISIIEAMGNGLVILSTEYAGIPDIARNDKNGCIIPYNESIYIDYLSYIESLSDQDILKIASFNYQSVIDNFLESNYISNLDKCFSEIIG